nr:hypothetical protein [Fischerella sp. PCC 9605]
MLISRDYPQAGNSDILLWLMFIALWLGVLVSLVFRLGIMADFSVYMENNEDVVYEGEIAKITRLWDTNKLQTSGIDYWGYRQLLDEEQEKRLTAKSFKNNSPPMRPHQEVEPQMSDQQRRAVRRILE